MTEEETKGQKLEKELLMPKKNPVIEIKDEDRKVLYFDVDSMAEDYKKFLMNKTEREVVDYTIELLKTQGYKEFELGKKYSPGDKIYMNNRGKALIMATFGKKPLSEGLRIAVSHIDSPRLDFKPNPLYEDSGLAFLKTHYYGGIKKYQWTTIPLSIRGTVITKSGCTVDLRIGEDDSDPLFCITDLLPHLAQNQMKKPAPEIIEGEQLNILAGSTPYADDKVAEKVKLHVLQYLNEKYYMVESDFLSAELCAVPAYKPRDYGFDKSMIGAYGQDDKVCAFASLDAVLKSKDPEYTSIVVFADKEETGSDGNTGMRSLFFRDFIEDLLMPYDLKARHVLSKSVCFSCDVNAAVDPAFGDVFERNNCSFLGKGLVVSKYTGSRGKYSTNDASAETMFFVRSILDDNNIQWQVGELGKVDIGGGGTIASEISIHNLDTVDIGVPVLSMHAPLEIVSKMDLYHLRNAVKAFFECPKAK